MAKKLFQTVMDPFDLLGNKKKDKQLAAAQSSAASANAAAEKLRSDNAAAQKAAVDKAAAAEEANKQKAAQTQDESRRLALNDYLAQEGDDQSRRKFLVGAK